MAEAVSCFRSFTHITYYKHVPGVWNDGSSVVLPFFYTHNLRICYKDVKWRKHCCASVFLRTQLRNIFQGCEMTEAVSCFRSFTHITYKSVTRMWNGGSTAVLPSFYTPNAHICFNGLKWRKLYRISGLKLYRRRLVILSTCMGDRGLGMFLVKH